MNLSQMINVNGGIPIMIQQLLEYSTFLIVHPDHVGIVIGSGGNQVMGIAKHTETWIRIQEPNEWSNGFPWFIIKGREQSKVEWAFQCLYDVVRRADVMYPRWYLFYNSKPYEVVTPSDNEDIMEYDTQYEEYLAEPARNMNHIYQEAKTICESPEPEIDFAEAENVDEWIQFEYEQRMNLNEELKNFC